MAFIYLCLEVKFITGPTGLRSFISKTLLCLEYEDIENEQAEHQEKEITYTQHPTTNADLINVKRERQRVNEDRKLRRKWRRKQGYSLPVVGIDTHSDGEVSGMGTSFRGRRNSRKTRDLRTSLSTG